MDSVDNKLDPATELAVTRVVDRRIREVGVHREDFTELKDALTRLSGSVDLLAKAQDRTEKRVEELAINMGLMARAQTRTEKTVRRLSEDLGVGLEDLGETLLPGFLLREHEIRVKRFENRELEIDGHSFEIDLYGKGKLDKKAVLVLVEVKTRATKSVVTAFDRRIKKIRKLIPERVVPVLFGMRMTREARELAVKRKMLPISGNQV